MHCAGGCCVHLHACLQVHVCVRVCSCVCTPVCVHVCTCTHACAWVYVHVCASTHMCACVYRGALARVCTCTCVHLCASAYVYMCASVHCVHVCSCVHLCACVCACVCSCSLHMYVHVCPNAYVHRRVHVCTHTPIHMYVCVGVHSRVCVHVCTCVCSCATSVHVCVRVFPSFLPLGFAPLLLPRGPTMVPRLSFQVHGPGTWSHLCDGHTPRPVHIQRGWGQPTRPLQAARGPEHRCLAHAVPPPHHGEVIARATGSGDTRGLVTDPTPLGGVADHRVIPVPRPSSGAVGGALRWIDPSRSFLRA